MKKTDKKDRNASKPVQVALPGRPGGKRMTAVEAVTFARQLMLQQQWSVVVVLMQQVAEQVPGYLDAWLLLFDAHHRMGDFTALARVATRCLQHKPRAVPALVALATALRIGQRHQEARELIEKAVRLEPGNAKVLNHLGIVLKELGELAAALAVFNRCIRMQPSYCEPYWNRSDLLREPSDAEMTAMQDLLAQPNLGATDQARVHYALARAHEFLGHPDLQFEHTRAGAAAKRSSIAYDHQKEIDQTRRIATCFSPALLTQNMQSALPQADGLAAAATPVFICGLPRSGTTLAEQILSSHPLVVAGDELTDLPVATRECLRELNISQPFPDWAEKLEPADWQRIGLRYRSLTHCLANKTADSIDHRAETPRFFTDKNLQNYKAIGLIHLALPDARIIYCRRDPMDNLWGCYRQLFGDGLYFTYSQTELADTWIAANQLMQYWQQQLPEKIFVLDYEQLVADQENVTRALLDFVGLPWDAACLEFYKNPRAVRTTSATQVRSPITNTRRGQWRAFAQQLAELQQRLDQAGN